MKLTKSAAMIGAIAMALFNMTTAAPFKNSTLVARLDRWEMDAEREIRIKMEDVVKKIGEASRDLNRERGATAFTQDVLTGLDEEFGYFNLLVYHNQDSGPKILGGGPAYRLHYNLPAGGWYGGTNGQWDIWLLHDAEFHLEGEGGWRNWGMSGNYTRDGNDVRFYNMDGYDYPDEFDTRVVNVNMVGGKWEMDGKDWP